MKRTVKAKKAKGKGAAPTRKKPVVRRPKARAAAPQAHAAAAARVSPGKARALALASAEVAEGADVEVKLKSSAAAPVPVAAAAAPQPDDGIDLDDDGYEVSPPPAHGGNGGAPRKGTAIVIDDADTHDAPVVVKGGAPKVAQSLGDGIQVASKGPAKFSLEDMEALRKAIVIKGSGRIVAGINLDELKYDQEGLVAVVAQDRLTGAVLMQAFANKEALEKSLTSNEMTYFSRSRNKLWTKGEESGNRQKLVQAKVDCDKDSLLAIVEQTGVACHRETGTCFADGRDIPVAGFLGELDAIIAQRNKDRPEDSYTTRLLEDPSLAAGKVVEEAKEVALVLKGKPNKDTLQHEAADLLYHLLVACRAKGVGLRDIAAELMARHDKEEKAAKK